MQLLRLSFTSPGIKFVVTDGESPTQENSTALEDEEDGRWSIVLFNQASMMSPPETNYDSLTAAKKAGHSGITDWKAAVQEAFMSVAEFRDIKF